jgi:hypothetical protein
MLAFLASTGAVAQTNAEKYMLQERCGKQAASVFAKEYVRSSTTKDGHQYFNYENHYSLQLNKCFFLEIMTVIEKGKFSKQYRLFDLNENKEYGSYYNSDVMPGYVNCVIRDAQCRSERG